MYGSGFKNGFEFSSLTFEGLWIGILLASFDSRHWAIDRPFSKGKELFDRTNQNNPRVVSNIAVSWILLIKSSIISLYSHLYAIMSVCVNCTANKMHHNSRQRC